MAKRTATKRRSRDEDRSDAAAPPVATATADKGSKARSIDLDKYDTQVRKTSMDELAKSGRELVIYEASIRKSSDEYANSEGAYVNEKGERVFALLRFYYADDRSKAEQFVTTGGVRVVPVIEQLIAAGELRKGPIRLSVKKSGRVYLWE